MKKNIEVEFKPNSKELAEIFCDMYNDEQAEFFNYIAEITSKWDSPFCFQLQEILDTNKLTNDAKYIMKQIGEYSSKIDSVRKIDIRNLITPTSITNSLIRLEDRELKLRKVSGYTSEELIELFLCGAINIKKEKSNIAYTWCGDDDR